MKNLFIFLLVGMFLLTTLSATDYYNVTGTLNPDATGVYFENGTCNVDPKYSRLDGAYHFHSLAGASWDLNVYPCSGSVDMWSNAIGPAGTYTANGEYTGTGTITKMENYGYPTTIQILANATSTNNYTTDNLTCYGTANSSYREDLFINYTWYKNNVSNLTGQVSATNNTQLLVSTLLSGNLSNGDVWKCGLVSYDGVLYETTRLNSTAITITSETPPTTDSSCGNTEFFSTSFLSMVPLIIVLSIAIIIFSYIYLDNVNLYKIVIPIIAINLIIILGTMAIQKICEAGV